MILDQDTRPRPSTATGAFAAEIATTFRDYENTDGAGRVHILYALADSAAGNPALFMKGLYLPEIAPHFQSPAFRLTVAQAQLLAGDTDGALKRFRAVFEEGERSPFLIDGLSRCLIEKGDHEAALGLLSDSEDALDQLTPLVARLAALAFLCKDSARADHNARRAHQTLPAELRQQILAENEWLDGLLTLDPDTRKTRGRDVIDTYRFEQNQLEGWNQYAAELSEHNSRMVSHSQYISDVFLDAITAEIQADPTIGTFINFGTLYPYVEVVLAKRFPRLAVIGYDRAPMAKRLNESHFRNSNLVFLDGPFRDAIAATGTQGTVLLGHARTCNLMFPDEVEALLADCRNLGIARIVGVEYFSFGSHTLEFPQWEGSNRMSILMGGHMINHDYGRYYAAAGFEPVRLDLLVQNGHVRQLLHSDPQGLCHAHQPHGRSDLLRPAVVSHRLAPGTQGRPAHRGQGGHRVLRGFGREIPERGPLHRGIEPRLGDGRRNQIEQRSLARVGEVIDAEGQLVAHRLDHPAAPRRGCRSAWSRCRRRYSRGRRSPAPGRACVRRAGCAWVRDRRGPAGGTPRPVRRRRARPVRRPISRRRRH